MDLEERDYEGYVRRIDQIDRILQSPIESLVKIVVKGPKSPEGTWTPAKRLIYVPSSIRADQMPETAPIHAALCCSTLQRVWIHRRRFPKLSKALEDLEKTLKEERPSSDSSVPELLAEPFLPKAPQAIGLQDLAALFTGLDDGPCDPYTASQVFWVLLNAGEKNTHTATGFFAFFLMTWALLRQYPEPGGVSIRNSPATAYLTAKSLAPLLSLRSICRRRTKLLDKITGLLRELAELMNGTNELRKRQWLPLRLDELSARLYELADIAVNRKGFQDCAKEIEEIAGGLKIGPDSETAKAWIQVVASFLGALRKLGTVGKEGLTEAQRVVNGFLPDILRALEKDEPKACAKELEKIGLSVPTPRFRDEQKEKQYCRDLKTSAENAKKACLTAFGALYDVSDKCSKLPEFDPATLEQRPQDLAGVVESLLGNKVPESGDPEAREGVLEALSRANKKIVAEIEDVVEEAVQWCERVLTREIAHASARNLTEFDPAELLSALFVTSSYRTGSSLRVKDAIDKALVGLREDGSWIPGQPFLVMSQDMGIWPSTSDILWMLSSILSRYQDVQIADDAVGAYVDWMERTKKNIRYKNGETFESVDGWISERNLREDRIDLWATTFAINALLGIRDLMEFRLWQLCEKRFTILEPSRSLIEIDAVDLGAIHSERLHHKLARTARQSAGDHYKDAEYSLILHGPPGSSKTVITEALAMEMWRAAYPERRGARLIRITPADFTRKGEDRLDSEARIIFSLLGRVRGVTILFDEIDDLLRIREGRGDASFFKLVVPAMLNRLQDLRDACPQQEICFVMATNYVDRIEPALLRKGRIDSLYPLVYPDPDSRCCTLGKSIAKLHERYRKDQKEWPWAEWAADLLEKNLGKLIINETNYWPWKTFDSFCKTVVEDLKQVWQAKAEPERIDVALSKVRVNLKDKNTEILTHVYDSSRTRRLKASPELRSELVQYSFAGAPNLTSFVNEILGHMRGMGLKLKVGDEKLKIFGNEKTWPEGLSDDLEIVLGKKEDLQHKINQIRRWRGW